MEQKGVPRKEDGGANSRLQAEVAFCIFIAAYKRLYLCAFLAAILRDTVLPCSIVTSRRHSCHRRTVFSFDVLDHVRRRLIVPGFVRYAVTGRACYDPDHEALRFA